MKRAQLIIILFFFIAKNIYSQTPCYYYYKGEKQYFSLNTKYAFLSLNEKQIPDNIKQLNYYYGNQYLKLACRIVFCKSFYRE
jgi:hypothetical protein